MVFSCDHLLTMAGAKARADRAFVALDAGAWQWYSRRDGADGRRFCDWTWLRLGSTEWMPARRSISDPSEPAFHRYWDTRPAGLSELVRSPLVTTTPSPHPPLPLPTPTTPYRSLNAAGYQNPESTGAHGQWSQIVELACRLN